MRTPRTVLGVALMLGAVTVLATAVPAQAAEASYVTECTPPDISNLPPVTGTTKADIGAPATAKAGDEIEVVWKTVRAASKNPDLIDLPENSVQPSGRITVAGAQTATLAVTGPQENPPIPKNGEMKLSDMKGTLKLTAPGEVTLTPGGYTINVLATETKCEPTEPVPVAARITVTPADSSTPTTVPPTTSTPAPTTAPPTTSSPTTSSPASDDPDDDADGTAYPGKEVSVPYKCDTLIGEKSATSKITVNAKKSGSGYALTVVSGGSVMDSPSAIQKGMITSSMKVKVAGAGTGTVDVTGPPNTKAFAAGDPITIEDLTGTYKPGGSGTVTLHPGVLVVALTASGTPVATCTPTSAVEASLTLDVAGQSGGVSGGNGDPTASSGTTTTSGGLAATGATNTGALHALALLAGTVLLLGGAVFTFTPWRRFRR